MQYVGRVNVLESPQYLVDKVADVICTQPLSFEQFVQVSLHQCLHHVTDRQRSRGTSHKKQAYIVKDTGL